MSSYMKLMNLEMKSSVLSVPLPSSISYMWNFGSLLGLCLVIQLGTGIFLTFHYSPSISEAFDSVLGIMENVNGGWFIRFLHANGASFFFVCIFLHIARGIYYKSFMMWKVWCVGVLILFILMGTAFLGYVLPWGQMSFWGATVITNLLSAFPAGGALVVWIWGGFSVSGPTLTRFFSLHYLLPFVLLIMSMAHILLLHSKGSSNPLGISPNSDKIYFHPYFTVKDILGVMVFGLVIVMVVMICPDIFMDCDNFIPANPMVTPPHIQPEWYFLFAYAILRSIPSKLGGVVALILAVACLFILPTSGNALGGVFSNSWKINFYIFCSSFVVLTWVGAMPVTTSLVFLGQVMSVVYFSSLMLMVIL